MIVKINEEERQVLQYIFRSWFVKELPPAIKDVAMGINDAISNPTKVNEEEYKSVNSNWDNLFSKKNDQ